MDLALDNRQSWLCHKTQQTKPELVIQIVICTLGTVFKNFKMRLEMLKI